MRFKRCRIAAYGPFTDLELDLSARKRDLHVFHGPNEAGKSSFLRALRALLFGIPAQSGDNFLHGYKQLRIAAELEKADGTSRLFQRRKGNKNTLLDANGDALAEAELTDYLGVVDQNYFDSMFGLGSEELRRGADELLRGEGRLGQALFSASLGGTPVERVIQDLEAEAGRYFSGRARKGVTIREAVKEVAEHRKQARESAVNPKDWEEIVREIEALEKRRRDLLSDRETMANRRAWLERCRDALTLVGQLGETRRNLASLPDMPELTDSFGDEIREARKAWQEAELDVEGLEKTLAQLHEDAGKCPLAPGVVAEEVTIDALHAEVGVYRDNKRKLVETRSMAGQLKAKVDKARRELGMEAAFDELDALRVSDPEFLEVREKASALQAAEEALGTARRGVDALEAEIAKLGAGRPSVADAEQLRILEDVVREGGVLETVAAELENRRTTAQGLQRAMERRHQHLSGAPDDHESTSKLAVPSKASIEKFRAELDALHGELGRCEADRAARQDEIDALDEDIRSLGRQRDLPSLDALQAARDHRDRGWKLVLEDWKGEGAREELVDGQPLETAYPEAVRDADGIADRLRVEAEAVAQIEEKRARRASTATALDGISRRRAELQTTLDGRAADWEDAWSASGITPRTPVEMAEWRDTWIEFCKHWDEWNVATRQIVQQEEAIASAEASLASAVGRKTGGKFLPLFSEAREMLRDLGQAAGAVQALEKQMGEKQVDLDALAQTVPPLEEGCEVAAAAWRACRDRWALPAELSPSNAVELLRSRRDMFGDYDRWGEVTREGGDLDQAVEAFEKQVAGMVTTLGLEPDDPENNEAACWKALQAARKEQTRHEGIAAQIATAQSGLNESIRGRDAARREFAAMFARTELDEDDALDDLLRDLAERVAGRKQVGELRDAIAGLTRGEPVDDFIARVESEDADAIDGSLGTLRSEIAALDDELEIVKAGLHEWEGKRRHLENADDEAARHAQLAESAEARIRHDADRFVRLRLAISLLEGQIDRFREQNQGPFMEKAGQWFSSLTGQAFTGITTSYDAGDEPVIAGLRADDRAGGPGEVLVSGMSEGTRDQLYLALRLAGLQMHLAEHEPMPMILDDLLVHFDDSRARHALTALGKLARDSQVLLFTHHSHLVGLATEALGDDGFHLHEF